MIVQEFYYDEKIFLTIVHENWMKMLKIETLMIQLI